MVNQKLYDEVKLEQRTGHTPTYSQLAHDITITTVLAIRDSHNYQNYQAWERAEEESDVQNILQAQ